MAIPREFRSLDEIPEALREYYVEQSGRWVLDDPGYKNADDVRRALAARDNEKNQAAELRREIESLKSKLGDVDLDQIPDALEALKQRDEIEQQKLIAEKRFEEAAEQKYKRQIAELQREIQGLQTKVQGSDARFQQLFSRYSDVSIKESLAKELVQAGINPEFLEAALILEGKRWEIDQDQWSPVPIELIENGQTKVTATGADGKPLTFKEHALTFVRDHPAWALQSNGAGATHQNGSMRRPITISPDDAKDHTKYMAAKASAERAGVELQVS